MRGRLIMLAVLAVLAACTTAPDMSRETSLAIMGVMHAERK